MLKNKKLIVLIFLFLFSFFIFSPSLLGSFVFDDRRTILNQPLIKNLSHLPLLFFSPYFYQKPQSGSYRPLVTLSYALDYLFRQTSSALFFHLTNLCLHSLNVILVFILIKKLFRRKKLAFFTALLFASHPLHAEAVCWISGRPELLCFFFSFLSILSFLEKRWLASGLFLLFALFSKETALILLPFYLVAWQHLGQKRPDLNQIFIVFFTLLIYFSGRYLALGPHLFGNDATLVENPLKFAPLSSRIFTALKIATLYLGKLIFPLKLSADYSYHQIPLVRSFFYPLTFIGLALLLFAIYCLLFTKNNLIRFALFFILLPYFLVANLFVPIGTLMAERLMYLPSLGFCLLLAYGLSKIRTKYLLFRLVILLTLCYSLRTFFRSFDWQNEFKLYSSMVQASPQSVLARSNLGGIYILQKEWDKAKEQLLIANQICECYPHAANNLGLVYQNENQLELAESWFKKAVAIDSQYQLAYKNLGILYFYQGKYQQAQKQFEIILPSNENNEEILSWLKLIHEKQNP